VGKTRDFENFAQYRQPASPIYKGQDGDFWDFPQRNLKGQILNDEPST